MNLADFFESVNIKDMINIGYSTDPFYRYKMSKLIIKVEKKKTVLVNIKDIASELRTNAEYITQSISYDLGCQVKNNTIAGIIDIHRINNSIDKFISQWIICCNCNLPETDLQIRDTEIYMSCKACGHEEQCDRKSKLYKVIMKNPPIKYSSFLLDNEFTF